MSLTKLPKKYWIKGKSKFLEFRPELQVNTKMQQFEVNPLFKADQERKVIANIERRSRMQINRNVCATEKDTDCYVNSEEYKNRHKKIV